MAKIELDKYYTSPELAKYCVEKTKEIIGSDNITEYIEPSAGSGVFLDYLDKPYLAYDIEPEDNRIVKQNYLELNLDYKKGRCIVGNPPFGTGNTLSVRFYKKAVMISDYISFILPISQLNNNQQMYEFDLIYSEDLGLKMYSDRNIHCCLNIYKRNIKGLNSKPNYKLKDVTIKEFRSNKNLSLNSDETFDLRICAWGASIGKEVMQDNHFAKEFYIKVINNTYKDEIINLIKNANWSKLYPMTATPNLVQWQVYKYIKEQIPDIE